MLTGRVDFQGASASSGELLRALLGVKRNRNSCRLRLRGANRKGAVVHRDEEKLGWKELPSQDAEPD